MATKRKAQTAEQKRAAIKMIQAGEMMSNWLFNMRQTDRFTSREKQQMHEMVQAWDAARKANAGITSE